MWLDVQTFLAVIALITLIVYLIDVITRDKKVTSPPCKGKLVTLYTIL